MGRNRWSMSAVLVTTPWFTKNLAGGVDTWGLLGGAGT
jgi:hypothetical protein